ncbi:DNA-dependent DNA polymerase family X [Patulibacter medicamentivorans]|uniref:DNA-directed DNA polymerase n=1 Tax=Patulibacter medicamentivorans TaxID=1097667 RepID=H0E2J4_9ACTN|nr:DNA polymerase/3'-5' exonuclease PolX [Patulibacter medicamentivorans]EHN12104.1 DNA-dependent DNA polymerase family X [Patulibacter medicamentivorans]
MAAAKDPSNAAIAELLDELGDLYELEGAVVHRVLAYRNAAKAIRDAPRSVAAMTREGRVTELPGVGKTLEEKLTALVETGEIPALEKLRSRVPAGLVVITRLPGLGPKRARKLHDALGVDGPQALRAAIEQHRVRDLAGFGAKSEERLLAALDAAGDAVDGPKREILSRALAVGEALVAELRAHPSSDRVELAGSARRWADSVKDLDIIATADDPQALIDAFAASDLIAEISRSGVAGAHAIAQSGIAIDLRVVAPDQFGNLLQHFTGSKAHNVAIREAAVRRGLHVSEYGILDDETGQSERFATEEEVYARLGLPWIPPELREDRGELQLTEVPPLIEQADLRGDLHMHTTASDGRASVREMAQAARALGLDYVAITDHSASHGFGDAVSPDRLRELIAEVRAVDDELDGITVLAGSEVNIGVDGSLDYDDELLAELDWIVASVHTAFTSDPTARIVAACEHPLVDVIGHPTGRKLEERFAYDLDVDAAIAAALRTGTFLEINGSPRRRDLDDVHARAARDAGVLLTIDSDAHGPEALANTRWGVATARRAWLSAADVANTRPWEELRKLRKGAR